MYVYMYVYMYVCHITHAHTMCSPKHSEHIHVQKHQNTYFEYFLSPFHVRPGDVDAPIDSAHQKNECLHQASHTHTHIAPWNVHALVDRGHNSMQVFY
jgi:hypothetical protein